MIKKKAAATGKAAKKKTGKKKPTKKKLDPAKVREELAGIVKSGAKGITKAAMAQARQGGLSHTKYLLDLAGVFPRPNDGEQATEEEDCLAKTLLDRLNVPRKPSQGEEDEDEDKPASGASVKDSAEAKGEPGKEGEPPLLAKDARNGAPAELENEGQNPHPFGKLRAGSVAQDATRVGHPAVPEALSAPEPEKLP